LTGALGRPRFRVKMQPSTKTHRGDAYVMNQLVLGKSIHPRGLDFRARHICRSPREFLRCALGRLGRIGPLQCRDRTLSAPDGLRVMPERDIGVRVAGQLGHQADFDTLSLQRRNEAMARAMGGNQRQTVPWPPCPNSLLSIRSQRPP